MTASRPSTSGHVVFAFSITALGMIVQTHFHNTSPLDEHPISIWIFIICSLFYCFALGYNIKCQICDTSDTISLDRSVKVAFISGSFAYAALISVLVPRFLQPHVFIICFIMLLIYFNRKKVAKIRGDMGSYLSELWTRMKSRASCLYEPWSRSESGNAAVINRPPV